MTEQQNTLQERIIARAMKDEAFRQELLSNPKAVLERVMGITVPAEVTIQVHEDTPTTVHLVLPMLPQSGEPGELSDAELELTRCDPSGTCGNANTHIRPQDWSKRPVCWQGA